MLTLFSIPKPFQGHIEIIQRNAIRSWTLLQPECEILLFGDEQGTAEVAAEYGVRHVPDIACNEYGTPLISDLFFRAQQIARTELLCYINADIILMQDFLQAIASIVQRKRQFLCVGRRLDIEISTLLNFEADWTNQLQSRLAKEANLHSATGIDYFIFRRGQLPSMPPFAVGRPMWDNWLIYQTRRKGIAVIDATQVITAIHQSHDYTHVPRRCGHAWEGPEADHNRALAGGFAYAFTIEDATWLLLRRGLVPALSWRNVRQRYKRLPLLHPRLYGLLRSVARPIRPLLRVSRAYINKRLRPS